MTDELTYVTRQEYELQAEQREPLRQLLRTCFPEYFEDRIFAKQVPHFRRIVMAGRGVVAQVGVDHRVVRVGEESRSIFGLIDLAVHPEWRGRGIGGRLLEDICELGAAHAVDAAILMADDHRIYERHGFVNIAPDCQWFGIHELRSLERMGRHLGDCFMVRPLGEREWPAGPVDFLGYLF